MNKNQDSMLIIKSTFPNMESASVVAKLLVEQQAAACVNLLPGVRSFYIWQDQLEHTEEIILLIKTQTNYYNICEQILLANHPYDTPEVIAWHIEKQNPSYFDWVKHQLSQR